MKYDIYKVYYTTYAEIVEFGDRKSELVAKNMTFEAGTKFIQDFGFGYSLHPTQMDPRRQLK